MSKVFLKTPARSLLGRWTLVARHSVYLITLFLSRTTTSQNTYSPCVQPLCRYYFALLSYYLRPDCHKHLLILLHRRRCFPPGSRLPNPWPSQVVSGMIIECGEEETDEWCSYNCGGEGHMSKHLFLDTVNERILICIRP